MNKIEEEKKEMDLLYYWRIFLKRKWVIISYAFLVVIFTGLFTFTATPIFRASASVIIEEPGSNMLNLQELFSPDYSRGYDYTNRYFNTQLEILTSRSLAERVVHKLNLRNRPEPAYKPNPDTRLAFTILDGLDIEPVEETKVVKVFYTCPFPVLSADVVNSLVEEFINRSIETRYGATQQAAEFLKKQIIQLREELAAKEKALQKYGEEKKLFFLNKEESTVVSKFADLNQAFTQAQIDRIKKEAKFHELGMLKVDAIPPYVDNSLIQSLREEYTRLKSDYVERSKEFKPDYPEMIKLRAKIEGIREELEAEIKRAVETAEAEYRSALNREKSLEVLLDSQREDVIVMNSNAINYKSLEIEVDNKRRLLNSLVAKRNETLVSARLGGLKTSNIRIMDRALVPQKPVFPQKKTNFVLALLFGLFGGFGLVFMMEDMDTTVKEPEEVERLTGIPSLGIIPYLYLDGGKNKGLHDKYYYSRYYDRYSSRGDKGYYKSGKPEPRIREIELINYLYPKFSISEDYRTLRTSLLLSQGEYKLRVISFLSSLSREGRTANTVNTAVSFSQLGNKVLILDADLRKPRIHKIFRIENKVGLSSFLTGNFCMEEAVQKTAVENLYLIPSGPKPPNPAELLNSRKMEDLIGETKERFDIVLIDTPPVLAVIDGIIISSFADGAVFVIQAEKTLRKTFLTAVEKIRNAKVHIFGVFFNGARIERRSSSYYSYYQHHYYSEEDSSLNGRKMSRGRSKESEERKRKRKFSIRIT